jgi:phage tail sheath protein FI
MQGGFDGAKPNLKKYSGENITAANTFGFACNSTTAAGVTAYNKAFALLSNTDYYDMNLLVTPGIIQSLHPIVTNAARQLAENRQDTFYVMDSNAATDSITTVINQVSTLDSSYTATYWPWLQIRRPDTGVAMFVPPSVMLPGVLAFTDQNANPWYAPAGLNRGSLTAVSATKTNLTQADRDALYNARVNPIANFPNEGVVVWGQKTLQARPSALDRVNVRRLLIAVKKYIASSTRYLVFEQNTDATRLRFLSIVNPYLDMVKQKQGLYQFRVVMDQSNNTPDLIDQNILYGQIFLQPTRTAEFIILDFNIQPTGASFPV